MKLHQRGATYHLRARVPSDLVEVVGRREIHQSLRATDGRTARSRASQLRASIDGGFDRLRLARLSAQGNDQLADLANGLLSSLGGARRNRDAEVSSKKPLRLRELMDVHLREKQPSLDPRSYNKMAHSYRIAAHLIGNIPLRDLNRSVCRGYLEKLREAPQYLLRDDTASKKTDRRLSDKSVNHHLQYLSALLRWATLEEVIGGNPAEGLALRKRQREWDERFAFDGDQLQRLLGSLWVAAVIPHGGEPQEQLGPLVGRHMADALGQAVGLFQVSQGLRRAADPEGGPAAHRKEPDPHAQTAFRRFRARRTWDILPPSGPFWSRIKCLQCPNPPVGMLP